MCGLKECVYVCVAGANAFGGAGIHMCGGPVPMLEAVEVNVAGTIPIWNDPSALIEH